MHLKKRRHNIPSRLFGEAISCLEHEVQAAVVSAGVTEVGTVVQVEGVDGAAPPVKKARYSLTLNDVSAAPGAAAAAPGPAAPVAAVECGQDKMSSRLCSPH